MRTQRRGFALIIVVICSVAVVSIAVALAFTAGANQIVSVKGSSIDRAETIAIAGIERAVAYAERVAAVERDFDQLLDPGLVINCASPGAAVGSGLPRFTDPGGVIRMVGGRQYLAIPFNEGAYLVRFDDDNDDLIANGFFAPFANNHPTNGCSEGPTAPGLNNSFRDRNRAVFITVIGIYPGTDPAHAPHHVSLQRYHVSTARLPAPAMVVRGDIEVNNGLTFCSALGDVISGGKIKLDAPSPVCGTPTAASSISATMTPPGADCSVSECASQGSPAPNTPFDDAALTAVIQPASSSTWRQPEPRCNLYALKRSGGTFGGLFFWDAGAAAGACTTMPSSIPAPTADGVLNPNQCWRPMFLTTGSGDVVNLLGWSDVQETGAKGWSPQNAAATVTPLTADTTVGGKIFPSGYTATPHNWAACKVQWKAVVGEQTCSGCDGTHVVATANADHIQLNFTTPAAIPAITVRFAEFKTSENSSSSGAVPATDAPAGWGLATILSEGKVEIDDNSNTALGFGVPGGAPSLVVGGELKVKGNSALTTAGSVVVNGDVTLEGNAKLTVFGAVLVNGKLKASGSSEVTQDYQFDVFGLANRPLIGVPTTSRALR